MQYQPVLVWLHAMAGESIGLGCYKLNSTDTVNHQFNWLMGGVVSIYAQRLLNPNAFSIEVNDDMHVQNVRD